MASPTYYGNGSGGALNVTSGTTNLALNTIHQFTDVTIAAGATLSTSSTSGAVMIILATGTVTIDGTINLRGVLGPGQRNDNIGNDIGFFQSPSVAQGGYGGFGDYHMGGITGNGGSGYGGGGHGAGNYVVTGSNFKNGGNGGTGGPSPTGGDGPWIQSVSQGQIDYAGGDGTNSGGGGGSSSVYSLNGTTVISDAGNGGASHGANGGDGGGTFSGGGNYGWVASGGGGAGGVAGRAGVHLVIRAKRFILGPTGVINLSGTNGGNGGYGGQTYTSSGWDGTFGGPGGGGGGGNGGSFTLNYSHSSSIAGTITKTGGIGGSAGVLRGPGGVAAANGSNGTSGTETISRYIMNDGNFLSFF